MMDRSRRSSEDSEESEGAQNVAVPNAELEKMTLELRRFGVSSLTASEDDCRPASRMHCLPRLSGSGIFDLSGEAARDLEPQRKVAFAASLVTSSGKCPHDLYNEEIKAQWYDADEYFRIRQDSMRTVDLIKSGQTMTEEEHCKRGLELYFRQNVSFLKSREDIVYEILDKQVDLWSEGAVDQARLLAEIYVLHSTQYAFKAVVTGLHDWSAIQAENTDSKSFITEIARMQKSSFHSSQPQET